MKNGIQSFNIPLAGWLLSLATFLVGSIIPPIYNRLTFDGVSVGQIAEVNYSSGSPEVQISLEIRIANTNKNAIAIESIETNVQNLSRELPLTLELQDVGIVDRTSKEVEESLPILILPEKSETIQIKQVYAFEVRSGIADNERRVIAAKALADIRKTMEKEGFELGLVMNGKIRHLTVRAKSSALRPLAGR